MYLCCTYKAHRVLQFQQFSNFFLQNIHAVLLRATTTVTPNNSTVFK